MAFLEAQHIVKRYARHLALDDVSIAVPQGSVFGLMGPNGAGKTTLIRIINRITAPDSGEILFEGRRFAPTDVARIGYLPEERGLYRKMKVGEQAIYLARLKGIDKATARKRLTEWFEKFDIMPWWNRKVEELSKGMQQKIQFVCTVIHEPDLLIFDEPFSGFDPVNAELLKQEILTLRDQGRTIIFSTHNMQSVEEVCDECALFNKSHVVLQGNVSEVRQRFAQGIVSLEVETSAPLSQEQLSQLSVVDSNFYPGEKKQLLRLKMRAGEDLRDLVQTLPRELHLLSLREEIPSMNEIFIQTITQQQNHQEDHE
ncbi:ABC transporter ATP-binding protein [Porphyromonas endodontalis]|uniref:ABC transporter ATP-binding protein n=1 Tax=Porphyromonas endodontalis TaxID=28124 RepID=UPI003C7B4FBD